MLARCRDLCLSNYDRSIARPRLGWMEIEFYEASSFIFFPEFSRAQNCAACSFLFVVVVVVVPSLIQT